jgi:hypothetical protein
MSWDPTDKLVVERDGVVSIAWPMSRFLEPFGSVGAASRIVYEGNWVASGPAISTEDFTRFLATRVEDEAWGYVGFDGAFTPTTDLPPVYQRTGRERPAGADAHGLGEACDSGGTPAASGCWLVETDADHVPVATWLDLGETSVYDFAWTVDGKSVWMLLDGGTAGGSQVATLSYARDVDTRVERARIDVTDGVRPQILGFGEELSPGSETVVAIGDDQGRIHAFVLEGGEVVTHDGTAWFAGWAADPAPYDPD